jgi:riboflavin transporter FmnP
VIPNRLASAAANLYALPVLMQIIALGAAAAFVPRERIRKIGWWLVVVGGTLLVAVTILLIVRILISAAFLSGVYGAFGKAAATSALVGVALVIELVGLLPLFQIKYMRSRAGRRVYAMAQ